MRSLPLALPGVAPVSVSSLNEKALPPSTVTVGVPADVANVRLDTGPALRVVASRERPDCVNGIGVVPETLAIELTTLVSTVSEPSVTLRSRATAQVEVLVTIVAWASTPLGTPPAQLADVYHVGTLTAGTGLFAAAFGVNVVAPGDCENRENVPEVEPSPTA